MCLIHILIACSAIPRPSPPPRPVTCQSHYNTIFCVQRNRKCYKFCLFELMFYIPVNSQGHVGRLPPFYGTCTQNEDVMTSNKCLKYNHPTKAHKAYTYERIDLSGNLRPELLTSNQMVSQ